MAELPFIRGRNVRITLPGGPELRIACAYIGALSGGHCMVTLRTYVHDESGFAHAAELPGKTLEWRMHIMDGRTFGHRLRIEHCDLSLEVGLSDDGDEVGPGVDVPAGGARKEAAMYVYRLACSYIETLRE